jgi:hypothetical protein
MEQSHEGLGAVRARFACWLERFYLENADLIFAPVIRQFGEEPVAECRLALALSVLQQVEERFSERQIAQFLAAMDDERRYESVRWLCSQILECQQLWRVLTESGVDLYRQQIAPYASPQPCIPLPASRPPIPPLRSSRSRKFRCPPAGV